MGCSAVEGKAPCRRTWRQDKPRFRDPSEIPRPATERDVHEVRTEWEGYQRQYEERTYSKERERGRVFSSCASSKTLGLENEGREPDRVCGERFYH